MSKLQSIQNMSGWIQKSVPGQVKVGILPLQYRNSFGILASRYNTTYGRTIGRYVHYSYNYYKQVVVIVVEKLEEHEQLCKTKGNERKWRELIPRWCLGKEPLDEGTEYKFDSSSKVILNASDTVYTVRDIANMLGRKECTIRRRIENGLLPAHKVGRCWYILKSEFVDGLRNI